MHVKISTLGTSCCVYDPVLYMISLLQSSCVWRADLHFTFMFPTFASVTGTCFEKKRKERMCGKTRSASASWTFPQTNEFISWEEKLKTDVAVECWGGIFFSLQYFSYHAHMMSVPLSNQVHCHRRPLTNCYVTAAFTACTEIHRANTCCCCCCCWTQTSSISQNPKLIKIIFIPLQWSTRCWFLVKAEPAEDAANGHPGSDYTHDLSHEASAVICCGFLSMELGANWIVQQKWTACSLSQAEAACSQAAQRRVPLTAPQRGFK